MKFSSSICFGQTAHQRFLPKPHGFKYPLIMPLLDLDEIEQLPALSRWLRVNRSGGMYSFCEQDILRDHIKPDESLKARAIRLLNAELGSQFPANGRVLLLSQWRFLGKTFNPITLLYFLDADDNLAFLMAEVSNTPWNERQLYCHQLEPGQTQYQRTTKKVFHVSPYNPMDMVYDWSFSLQPDRVALHLRLMHQGERHFDASFSMRREPMTQATFKKMLLQRPLMSLHAVLGIYWQALKLFVKRIPIYDHQPNDHEQSA